MKKISLFIGIFSLVYLSCSTDRNIKTFLPEQVNYVGPGEDYFLGSGVSGAMGNASGVWTALLGPNYTHPIFLRKKYSALVLMAKRLISCLICIAEEEQASIMAKWR